MCHNVLVVLLTSRALPKLNSLPLNRPVKPGLSSALNSINELQLTVPEASDGSLAPKNCYTFRQGDPRELLAQGL